MKKNVWCFDKEITAQWIFVDLYVCANALSLVSRVSQVKDLQLFRSLFLLFLSWIDSFHGKISFSSSLLSMLLTFTFFLLISNCLGFHLLNSVISEKNDTIVKTTLKRELNYFVQVISSIIFSKYIKISMCNIKISHRLSPHWLLHFIMLEPLLQPWSVLDSLLGMCC